jgi:Tol biopolymer transport system component
MLQRGESEAALGHFVALSTRYPRAAQPRYEAARLYYERDEVSLARQFLLEALDRHPPDEVIQGILEITNWWMISSPLFFNSDPVFSPDGKKVIYASVRRDANGDGKMDADDPAGLYVFDIETGADKSLVSDETFNGSPVWSPDGRAILYTAAWKAQETNLPVFSKSPRHLFHLNLETMQSTLLVAASLSPRYPMFTPDSRKMIVCTVDFPGGPSGLSVVDIATQRRQPLTSHAYEHTFPQVSPDGKRLVYASWREDTGGDGRITLQDNPGLYEMNLESMKESQLVSDRYANAYARFSPRGEAIVYLSRRRDTNGDGKIDHLDNYGIYTMRLNDRCERCVSADDHYNKFPAWSSDGRAILCIACRPHLSAGNAPKKEDYFEFKGLYRMPASGGTPQRIVSERYFGSRYCEVAPRGSLVAYVSWRPQTNRGLYIADYQKLPTLDQLRGFIQNNLPN